MLLKLLRFVEEPNRSACFRLMQANAERFEQAWGSSHNHQAWPGGYIDHVTDVMLIAYNLYDRMKSFRPVPFSLSDALLVLFLHDVEKPWKRELKFTDKSSRRIFREQLIQSYGISLTGAQANALMYVEGEGDDYSSSHRVMNELAAFCHMCDVASARIWHSKPEVTVDSEVEEL